MVQISILSGKLLWKRAGSEGQDATASQNRSTPVLVEAYLLQAKLKLIEFQIHDSQELLAQALQVAQKKGFLRLEKLITMEQELLSKQVSIWEKIGEKKPTFRELIQLTRLQDLFTYLQQKSLYKSEEEMITYAENARQFVKTWGDWFWTTRSKKLGHFHDRDDVDQGWRYVINPIRVLLRFMCVCLLRKIKFTPIEPN